MARRKFHFDIRQSGRKIVTVLLVILAANILWGALAVRPMIRDYQMLEEQNQPRITELRNRQVEVQRKETFLDDLNQAREDLRALREDVLSTRQRRLVSVQLELAKLASQFQINLERVQYDNAILEGEGLERFLMVVPLEGGYANLRQFIRAVENSDRFLVIERVVIDRAKHGGVLLQLNISLATYFDMPAQPGKQAGGRTGPGGSA